MMETLGQHVAVPSITQNRLDQQWRAIERQRREAPRRRKLAAAVLGASLAAAALLLFLQARSLVVPPSLAPTNAAIETRERPLTLALADGSQIVLEPLSRLEVQRSTEDAVDVQLERGSVAFNVTPNPHRAFVVKAGALQVSVVGTRFLVSRRVSSGSEIVSVEVTEGTVRVSRGRAELLLHAGESWSASGNVAGGTSRTPAEAANPADSQSIVVDRPIPIDKLPSAKPVEPPQVDAKTLFDDANQARRSGRPHQAAQLYEKLIARFPSDSRSGLAAFELGRLRMDQLGDRQGAIKPLEMAASAGAFREDALARLVAVHASRGSHAACQAAKAKYLSLYPRGVHRASVEAACARP